MEFENIRKILEDQASREGLDKYEIYFTAAQSLSTDTLKDEISSFSSQTGAGVSFRCIVDGRMGSAATELFEEGELRELVGRAKANASVIEKDEGAIIYAGSDSYENVARGRFGMPEAAQIKQLALELQRKTYESNSLVTDGTESGAFANVCNYELANSEGLRLSNTVGVGGVYVQAVVNRDGEAQEAFDACVGLDGAGCLPERVVAQACSRLGAECIPSGKYKVIIDGKQMRALLSTYRSVFSGKSALLGLSLLAGKEGQRIAAECVNIIDDPLTDKNPVPTAFDGEGVATHTKSVVEGGVLKTLLYDLETAHKAGVQSTGNGQRASYANQVAISPFCFYMDKGEYTEQQLLERLGDGLYITNLKGLHAGADAVTGDFSLESAGYRVESGKMAGAVKGFTVAGNFFELLRNIEAVADEVKFGLPSGFVSFGAPDVFVGEMSVSGI